MDTPHALIAAHDAGWNAQDLDAIMATYTGDIVFQNHTAGEQPVIGADAVRAHSPASSRTGPTCASREDVCTSRPSSAERVDRARDDSRRPEARVGRRRCLSVPRRPDRPQGCLLHVAHSARRGVGRLNRPARAFCCRTGRPIAGVSRRTLRRRRGAPVRLRALRRSRPGPPGEAGRCARRAPRPVRACPRRPRRR